MADTKISALPENTAPALDDYNSGVDVSAGATKRTTNQRIHDLTAGVTRKVGNMVILNPNNLGSYANAAAAIADVPQGGKLLIVEDYDVAVHGAINLSIPITIEGVGHGWLTGAGSDDGGTTIFNTGSPPVSDQCIDFSAASRMDAPGIKNLVIKQAAPGTYAVRFRGAIKSVMENVKIDCLDAAHGGVLYTENAGGTGSFFANARNIHVRQFTEYGIRVQGGGSQNNFYDLHIQSTIAGATAGVQIESSDSHVIGGQINCDAGPGIRFYANATFDASPSGTGNKDIVACTVRNILSESGEQPIVEFTGDGTYKCYDCHIYNITTSDHSVEYVRFDQAEDCVLHYPSPYGIASIDYNGDLTRDPYLAEFTANSKNCIVEATSSQAQLTVTNAAASVLSLVKVDTSLLKRMASMGCFWDQGVNGIVLFPEYYSRPLHRVDDRWAPISGGATSAIIGPADLTKCVALFDADEFDDTEDGNAQSAWNNEIIGGYDLDQVAPGFQPVLDIDVNGRGINGLFFDGISDRMVTSGSIPLGTAKGSIVACVTPSGQVTGTDYWAVGRYWQNEGIRTQITATSPERVDVTSYFETVSAKDSADAIDNIQNDDTIVIVGSYDGANIKTTYNMSDGDTQAAQTASFTRNASNWAVGSHGNELKFFKGYIHCVALFNEDLTDEEIKLVQFWMANKYRARAVP